MTDTKHTDSVESLAKELRMVANMINMGEKIQWGHETTLMDKAAEMLTTLHTPKDTNPTDSIHSEKDGYQHIDSVTAHNTQGFKSLTIEAGTGKIVGAETIEGELIQPFQHTDSVEAKTAIHLTATLDREVFKGRYSSSGLEAIEAVVARELTTLQAQTSQQVKEAFRKGQQVGKEALISHMIMEFGLPFQRTAPNHQD